MIVDQNYPFELHNFLDKTPIDVIMDNIVEIIEVTDLRLTNEEES